MKFLMEGPHMPDFTAPTSFLVTITPVAPVAAVDFLESPSGTLTVPLGGTLETRMTTKISNTGNWAGNFTVTAATSGGVSGAWEAVSVSDASGTTTLTPSTTPAAIPIAAGSAVSVDWTLTVKDIQVPAGKEPNADDSYDLGACTTVVKVLP